MWRDISRTNVLAPEICNPSKLVQVRHVLGVENVRHNTAGVAQCRRRKIIQKDFDIENLTIWKVVCAEDSTNRKTSKKARWAVFCRLVLPSSGGRREVASSKVTSVSLLGHAGVTPPSPLVHISHRRDFTMGSPFKRKGEGG